jgi:hypothetical protein
MKAVPRSTALGMSLPFFLVALAMCGRPPAPVPAPPQRLFPRIGTVDERFQSYNVEMAEVIGGNFWKPYDAKTIAELEARAAKSSNAARAPKVGEDPTMFESRPPIDLANERLRKLAERLGPAYMRTSGTWANTVYFHDADTPPPITPPSGFHGVLTRDRWKRVIDFTRAVDARIVTSFAIGAGVRDAAGVWTPLQAKRRVDFTQSNGGAIAAAEMFNEPTMPEYGGAPKGYDAAAYARDFVAFRHFAAAAAPDMLIVGPGAVGEGLSTGLSAPGDELATQDLFAALPRPAFDVFSYHFYGAASLRCASLGKAAQTSADAALSEDWLARTDTVNMFYQGFRNQFAAGKPVWVTETADAACGGNPWGATFLDTFRYVDQMGRLAKRGVKVIFHNTLASSEYGLLDERDFTPRPSYWAAVLWRQLMGMGVLDAGEPRAGLHLYAHCMRAHPGGMTLLAINNGRERSESVELPFAAERYTLGASRLESTMVQLNGRTLALGAHDELPSLEGLRVPAGRTTLAPMSITFFAMPGAEHPSCSP